MALAFKKQAASEKCRFCKQTVYLMEKTTVEGLVLHRNCLKCHHCHTNLRLGGYAFDRDDPQGRFYCTQHFRLPAKPMPQRVNKARVSWQDKIDWVTHTYSSLLSCPTEICCRAASIACHTTSCGCCCSRSCCRCNRGCCATNGHLTCTRSSRSAGHI